MCDHVSVFSRNAFPPHVQLMLLVDHMVVGQPLSRLAFTYGYQPMYVPTLVVRSGPVSIRRLTTLPICQDGLAKHCTYSMRH